MNATYSLRIRLFQHLRTNDAIICGLETLHENFSLRSNTFSFCLFFFIIFFCKNYFEKGERIKKGEEKNK